MLPGIFLDLCQCVLVVVVGQVFSWSNHMIHIIVVQMVLTGYMVLMFLSGQVLLYSRLLEQANTL